MPFNVVKITQVLYPMWASVLQNYADWFLEVFNCLVFNAGTYNVGVQNFVLQTTVLKKKNNFFPPLSVLLVSQGHFQPLSTRMRGTQVKSWGSAVSLFLGSIAKFPSILANPAYLPQTMTGRQKRWIESRQNCLHPKIGTLGNFSTILANILRPEHPWRVLTGCWAVREKI